MNVHFHEQDLLCGIQSDLLKPKVKKKSISLLLGTLAREVDPEDPFGY